MRSLTYYVTIITETRRLILIGRKFKKERKTGGVLKRAMKKKFLAGCSFAVAAAVVGAIALRMAASLSIIIIGTLLTLSACVVTGIAIMVVAIPAGAVGLTVIAPELLVIVI